MKNLSINDLCLISFSFSLFLVLFHFIKNTFMVGSPHSLAKDFAIHRSRQWLSYNVAQLFGTSVLISRRVFSSIYFGLS